MASKAESGVKKEQALKEKVWKACLEVLPCCRKNTQEAEAGEHVESPSEISETRKTNPADDTSLRFKVHCACIA